MRDATKLINHVESQLSPDTGKRFADIYASVTVSASPKAVRFAIASLITNGKIKRRGNLIFAAGHLPQASQDETRGAI